MHIRKNSDGSITITASFNPNYPVGGDAKYKVIKGSMTFHFDKFSCVLTTDNDHEFTYQQHQVIAAGNSSSVYEMTANNSFLPIVVKEIISKPTSAISEDPAKEAGFNQLLNGLGLYFEFPSTTPARSYIVMKRAPGVIAADYCIRSENNFLDVCLSAAQTLKKFHDHSLVHFDLHLNNILIHEVPTDDENKIVVNFADIGCCDYEGTKILTANGISTRTKANDIYDLALLFDFKFNANLTSFSHELKTKIMALIDEMCKENSDITIDQVLLRLKQIKANIMAQRIFNEGENYLKELDAERFAELAVHLTFEKTFNSSWEKYELFIGICRPFFNKVETILVNSPGFLTAAVPASALLYQKLHGNHQDNLSLLEQRWLLNFFLENKPRERFSLLLGVSPNVLRKWINTPALFKKIMCFGNDADAFLQLLDVLDHLDPLGDNSEARLGYLATLLTVEDFVSVFDDPAQANKALEILLQSKLRLLQLSHRIDQQLFCKQLLFNLKDATTLSGLIFDYKILGTDYLRENEGANIYLQLVIHDAENFLPRLTALPEAEQSHLLTVGDPAILCRLVNESNLAEAIQHPQAALFLGRLGNDYLVNIAVKAISPALHLLKILLALISDEVLQQNIIYGLVKHCVETHNDSFKKAIESFDSLRSEDVLFKKIVLAFNVAYRERRDANPDDYYNHKFFGYSKFDKIEASKKLPTLATQTEMKQHPALNEGDLYEVAVRFKRCLPK